MGVPVDLRLGIPCAEMRRRRRGWGGCWEKGGGGREGEREGEGCGWRRGEERLLVFGFEFRSQGGKKVSELAKAGVPFSPKERRWCLAAIGKEVSRSLGFPPFFTRKQSFLFHNSQQSILERIREGTREREKKVFSI